MCECKRKKQEDGDSYISLIRSITICRTYKSQNKPLIRVTKSMRMRWVGHVARMGGMEIHIDFKFENLKGRDRLGDLCADVG
jgi:hypothetical protein